jgi:ribosomal subunit interface protein
MKTINMPHHFGTGSALVEFLAGRLGAPECWPDDYKVKAALATAQSNRVRHVERQHRGRAHIPARDERNTIDMNKLPIHIMPDGIELSFALRKFIEKKISGLSRFAGDILSAEVVLREKSGANRLFSVRARLALPGRDVHGNAVHKNFYAVINQLVARLARLSRKRKTRFEKGIRRVGRFQFAAKALTDLRKQRPLRHNQKLSERSIVSLSASLAR